MENPKLGRRFLHYAVLDNFVDLKKSLCKPDGLQIKNSEQSCKTRYFGKDILSKIDILSNFFVKKSSLLSKVDLFLPKIEIFDKRSKFPSKNRNFCQTIEIFVKQSKFLSKNRFFGQTIEIIL